MAQDQVALAYGYRLLPKALEYLKTLKKTGAPRSMEECRADMDERWSALFGPPEPSALQVSEMEIDGPGGPLPITIFIPEGEGPFPMLMLFHGGGWTEGSTKSHGGLASKFAARYGAVTISVDYRLAPENPYPAAVYDCYAATLWAVKHAGEFKGDAARLAVIGDSSGGNLAGAVALMARNLKGPSIVAQVLICPVTDTATDTPGSFEEFANDPFVARKSFQGCIEMYVQDPGLLRDQYVALVRAEDLSGLPDALILTSELDVLRDEAELYAAKLSEAGVRTRHVRYNGHFHVSVVFTGLLGEDTEGAFAEIGAFLESIFAVT